MVGGAVAGERARSGRGSRAEEWDGLKGGRASQREAC